MVQCADGIVESIVVKKSKLVVNLSVPSVFGIIECGFVQVNRARKISLG